MKVLLCIERFDPSYGGAERYAADLARGLAGAGLEVTVAAEAFRDVPEGVRALPVEPLRAPKALRSWDFARRCALLSPSFDVSHALGKVWGTDILHPHGGSHRASLRGLSRSIESAPARWASGLLRAASLRQAAFRRIERELYRPGRARTVLAVSRMVARDLETLHGVPPDSIRVLYNPVDAGRFRPEASCARDRLRSRFGIPPDAVVCLFVANHFRLKGLCPLLRAAARLGRDAPTILVLGRDGKGPYERMAARLGLQGRVVFAGTSPEPEEFYGASDVFALPTFYDPCSLTALEAMASGLPVVTSRWNGASELIEHDRDGLVLEDPSRDDLLAEFLLGLRDPARRRALGGRAREKILGLTPGAHLRAVMNVYEEVVKAKRPV
jgi:UDP-glucose:(heptosyl)LPS alpha-1,3-glucosyltransferase